MQLSDRILQFEIPRQEYEERIARVRDALRAREIDFGIGYFSPFMPGISQYLTGFDPHIETAAFAVGTDAYILGGPEIAAQAEPVMKAGQMRTVLEFQVLTHNYPHAHYYRLKDVIAEVSLNPTIRRVGILNRKDLVPISWIEMLKEVVGPDVQFVDAQDILDDLRYIKSEKEIEAFKIACAIATEAVAAMLEALKPGMRELEVAAIGDKIMKDCGAYNFALDSMVMSGKRINTIVGRATNKVIEEGELVSIGVSPRFYGYAGTVARTVVAGKANDDQIDFLQKGANALEIAVANLKVGAPANKLEGAVHEYLKSVNLYEYVSYSVLHGIGLTEVLDEKAPRGDDKITASTTLMLDVGLFNHPVHHGFRHEDPYVIHADGQVERLTDLPVDVFLR